jgi:hypothetical protein
LNPGSHACWAIILLFSVYFGSYLLFYPVVFLFICFLSLRQDLTMNPRLAMNSQTYSLGLLKAEITGVHHHTRLSWFLMQKLRLLTWDLSFFWHRCLVLFISL